MTLLPGAQPRSTFADDLFGERSTVESYLRVEVALAKVQAEAGVIPEKAARAIAAVDVGSLNMKDYRESFARVGFPVVGLVQQLAILVPDGQGEYAHWGATTQDIMDTGLVLQLRTYLQRFETMVREARDHCAMLAQRYADVPMLGRSQLQAAAPTTFGLKAATMVPTFDRHLQRLDDLRPRLLMLQLGGAVGSLAAMGMKGFAVRKALAEELDLIEPIATWHTQRDGLSEFVSWLALVGASLAKWATDVIYLSQSEVGEVREPMVPGRGTSSTMPQKRNPVLSQQIVVAARQLKGHASLLLEAMIADHERGTASWQLEWSAVAEAASLAMGAVERSIEIFAGIEVNADRMLANLKATGGLVFAEAVMMTLAPTLGRQRAHDLLAGVVSRVDARTDFLAALQITPELVGVLSSSQIEALVDLNAATATAARMTALILATTDNET